MTPETAARTGISLLSRALSTKFGPDSVQRFMGRFGSALEAELAKQLTAQLASLNPDLAWRGRWHTLTPPSARSGLERARQDGTEQWLLSRIRIHRPDLYGAATAWANVTQTRLPADEMPVPRLVPGIDSQGRLQTFEVTEDHELENLPLLPKSAFADFARAAFLDNEQPAGVLLDIALGYFGPRQLVDPSSEDSPKRLAQLAAAISKQQRLDPAQLQSEASQALRSRLILLATAGVAPSALDRDKARPSPTTRRWPVPTALQIQSLLQPELRSPQLRSRANIEAIKVLEQPGNDMSANRQALAAYSGWGGLSIEGVKTEIPPAYLPSPESLIYEYLTPSAVGIAIADLLRPWVSALPVAKNGRVLALEPSAGIGRLLNAASTPGFETVDWIAVESSPVSAAILGALRPDIEIHESSFERYINEHNNLRVGLVLANPPFGPRGASALEDKNKNYREERLNQVYFLRRTLDLLARDGLGVFILPHGVLTGKSTASLRKQLLLTHHLRVAFRLPTGTFSGTSVVADIVVFESRGGSLPDTDPADQFVVDGHYFRRYPAHLLGQEEKPQSESDDDDDEGVSSGWRYAVRGSFTGLPDPQIRLRCNTCYVVPTATSESTKETAPVAKAALAPRVEFAQLLGRRVSRYLSLYSSGGHSDLGIAAALQPELADALSAWLLNSGDGAVNPWTDAEIQKAAKSEPDVVAFLSAYDSDGRIIPQISVKPKFKRAYIGPDSVVDQAQWLYSQVRELTETALNEWRVQNGYSRVESEEVASKLAGAGWAYDDSTWVPEAAYYSGLLWDRYFRAREAGEAGNALCAAQAARLQSLLKPKYIEDISPEPRMPWVPVDVTQKWIQAFASTQRTLLWQNGLLQVDGLSYAEIPTAEPALAVLMGYINHDFGLFKPKYDKQVSSEGEEESAEAALERTRLAYGATAKSHFREYLRNRPDLAAQVENAYNRRFTGFVMPTYSDGPIDIARWTGRIRLKPHQNAGVRRLVENNGGLLSFDTGVGKTYTGIATIAALRESGKARRPVVVVPNTIIWKWHKEFRSALPDFRVLVVGSTRYLGRSGVFVSKLDTPEERSLKWRQFQSGEWDVALVTFSVFARLSVTAESFGEWAWETPFLTRKMSMEARTLSKEIAESRRSRVTQRMLEAAAGGERNYKLLDWIARKNLERQVRKEKEKADAERIETLKQAVTGLDSGTERFGAMVEQALAKWIAQRMDSHHAADPGLTFEDLGVDLLMVDEAQNFKNLWPVLAREGGVPKYMGAITEGSDRAYALGVRAYLVRKKNGGSGVHLLSATPAKNSPLEYFNLLSYVDSQIWVRLGIFDPEHFIDRYLRLEYRRIITADLRAQSRQVVAGFINLDELRDVIFRYAEFRTASDVGLVLPKTDPETITVPMGLEQREKYSELSAEYRKLLMRAKNDPTARLRALGLLVRMSLCAIHPELMEGPQQSNADDDSDKTGWTYRNAVQVKDPSSPKLKYIVEQITARPGCGHLVFVDNVAVHRWLHMLLVKSGYPEDRIAVLNAEEAKDPLKRQQIAEAFNGTAAIFGDDGRVEQEAIPPEFDVVIANATAYEGIDLHVRTCEVYHLDLPWEPATLQQRNGRAVRQGNQESVVAIRYVLSERSLDAVRLSMILGKLGWMTDLLASADRDTNNPAAQSELTGEEMVLMLASSPEEAREAIETQKKLLAAEQTSRLRTQAWTAMRSLLSRVSALSRIGDDLERQELQKEVQNLSARIEQIPADVFAYKFLVPLAREGRAIAFMASQASEDVVPLPEDWQVVPESDNSDLPVPAAFAIGLIRQNRLGYRMHGSVRYMATTKAQILKEALQWPSDYKIPAASIELGPQKWDHESDIAGIATDLENVLKFPNGSFDDLGLALAPESFRRLLVDHYWTEILSGVVAAKLPIVLPVSRNGRLFVVDAQKLVKADFSDVIPFVFSAWELYVELVSKSPAIAANVVKRIASQWWGRSLPRGLVADEPRPDVVVVKNGRGETMGRDVLGYSSGLAIALSLGSSYDDPGGPTFALVHAASGLALATDFKSVEAADAAMTYAAPLIDWMEAVANLKGLPTDFLPRIREFEQQS